MVASQEIPRGEYVTEYKTKEVYPRKQMANHIAEYELNQKGCYILEVQTPKGWVCLDANPKDGVSGSPHEPFCKSKLETLPPPPHS